MTSTSASSGPNPSGLCVCGCGRPTSIAKQSSRRLGWVQGQPVRYLKGHHTRLSGPEYLVDPETGCWIWQGGRTRRDGYGRLKVGGKKIQAHRYYYEKAFGPIPETDEDGNALFCLHHCDNPPCVNPEHLFLGTKSDNAYDMVAKGRHGLQKRKAVAA